MLPLPKLNEGATNLKQELYNRADALVPEWLKLFFCADIVHIFINHDLLCHRLKWSLLAKTYCQQQLPTVSETQVTKIRLKYKSQCTLSFKEWWVCTAGAALPHCHIATPSSRDMCTQLLEKDCTVTFQQGHFKLWFFHTNSLSTKCHINKVHGSISNVPSSYVVY